MPKIEITLSRKSLECLNRLTEKIDGHYSGVINNSLRLFESAIDEADQGGKVVVIRPDGTQIPIFEKDDNGGDRLALDDHRAARADAGSAVRASHEAAFSDATAAAFSDRRKI